MIQIAEIVANILILGLGLLFVAFGAFCLMLIALGIRDGFFK